MNTWCPPSIREDRIVRVYCGPNEPEDILDPSVVWRWVYGPDAQAMTGLGSLSYCTKRLGRFIAGTQFQTGKQG